MRPSAQLLSRGFWGRSLDEAKRFTRIAVNLEAIRLPTAPFPLVDFTDPEQLARCKTISDADIGGFSKAALDFVPATDHELAHARFHGVISTALPENRPDVQRTGYAAWRTRDPQPTLFGKGLWDIDPYAYLAIRLKADEYHYFVNLQTDSIVPTDIHQHRLDPDRLGEWETIYIKWQDFVRTNHGRVVEPQSEMLRQRLKTVGLGLPYGFLGTFDLRIQSIWATNEKAKEDLAREQEDEEEYLEMERTCAANTKKLDARMQEDDDEYEGLRALKDRQGTSKPQPDAVAHEPKDRP